MAMVSRLGINRINLTGERMGGYFVRKTVQVQYLNTVGPTRIVHTTSSCSFWVRKFGHRPANIIWWPMHVAPEGHEHTRVYYIIYTNILCMVCNNIVSVANYYCLRNTMPAVRMCAVKAGHTRRGTKLNTEQYNIIVIIVIIRPVLFALEVLYRLCRCVTRVILFQMKRNNVAFKTIYIYIAVDDGFMCTIICL